MMEVPETIWLFRITHINNLAHVLQYGIVTMYSPNVNNHFTEIGDQSLIHVRGEMTIPVSPGGSFSEYIPFYFGVRQPMLYQIVTGWEVEQIPQEQIVYIVSKLSLIQEQECSFVFTDGHARHNFTRFFNDPKNIDQLDWETIHATDWKNTLEDPDRQRRKQAEILVKDYVPLPCIDRILVYNEKAKEEVNLLVRQSNFPNLKVQISTKAYYG